MDKNVKRYLVFLSMDIGAVVLSFSIILIEESLIGWAVKLSFLLWFVLYMVFRELRRLSSEDFDALVRRVGVYGETHPFKALGAIALYLAFLASIILTPAALQAILIWKQIASLIS